MNYEELKIEGRNAVLAVCLRRMQRRAGTDNLKRGKKA